MISELLKPAVQDFIQEHADAKLDELLFKASKFPDIPMKLAVEQIEARTKAKTKLPTWWATEGLIFPSKISMEQCSSEETAEFKATLFSGKSMVDLTGGTAVDAYAFSKKFKKVIAVEPNAKLVEMGQHNFKMLGAENVDFIQSTAEDYLKQSHPVALIYVDPSRRDEANSRQVLLSDSLPDVIELLPQLQALSQNILIKASPMISIKSTIAELGASIDVHVVAVKNEVKEVLFELSDSATGKISSVNLTGAEVQSWSYLLHDEETTSAKYSTPRNYLYEPNAAIMKGGGYLSFGNAFGLAKLHPHSHLYTSEERIDNFPGRVFEVFEVLPYKPKQLKRSLGLTKANIAVRNFPLSVQQIREQLKIKDGGEAYLFATTFVDGSKRLIICRKNQ